MGTQVEIGNFTKVLCLGNCGANTQHKTFVNVVFKDGKLSLTGVQGPYSNGNAWGACGQIQDYILDVIPNSDWTKSKIEELKDVWDKWHLNDMRAGCEHQRAEDWGNDSIEVVDYSLTTEAYKQKREIEARIIEAAALGVCIPLTDAEKYLIGPDCYKNRYFLPGENSPAFGMYEEKKREIRKSGWVYDYQHPDGVLCKPCPTCGYKYGSAWLHEDVPHSVLNWLKNLPDSCVKPAWC